MLETICPKCRQRYPLGQAHVCPKKSTAARKDVLTNRLGRAGSTPASSTTAGDMGESEARPTAGTQAPPVDKPKRVDTRKGDRHRADYWKTYQRPDRAAKTAKEPK